MKKEKTAYIKDAKKTERLVRIELILAPLLVIFPFIAGFIFIYGWYIRGFLTGSSAFDGELILGIIIIFGNLVFDIPFIKSLRNFTILSKKLKN
jgi:hypothetical protein